MRLNFDDFDKPSFDKLEFARVLTVQKEGKCLYHSCSIIKHCTLNRSGRCQLAFHTSWASRVALQKSLWCKHHERQRQAWVFGLLRLTETELGQHKWSNSFSACRWKQMQILICWGRWEFLTWLSSDGMFCWPAFLCVDRIEMFCLWCQGQ